MKEDSWIIEALPRTDCTLTMRGRYLHFYFILIISITIAMTQPSTGFLYIDNYLMSHSCALILCVNPYHRCMLGFGSRPEFRFQVKITSRENLAIETEFEDGGGIDDCNKAALIYRGQMDASARSTRLAE